jgi:hypothetical protein
MAIVSPELSWYCAAANVDALQTSNIAAIKS